MAGHFFALLSASKKIKGEKREWVRVFSECVQCFNCTKQQKKMDYVRGWRRGYRYQWVRQKHKIESEFSESEHVEHILKYPLGDGSN